MSVIVDVCARCKKQWDVDDPAFHTCPSCRIRGVGPARFVSKSRVGSRFGLRRQSNVSEDDQSFAAVVRLHDDDQIKIGGDEDV